MDRKVITSSPANFSRPFSCAQFGVDKIAILCRDDKDGLIILDIFNKNFYRKDLKLLGIDSINMLCGGPNNGLILYQKNSNKFIYLNNNFELEGEGISSNFFINVMFFCSSSNHLYCGLMNSDFDIEQYDVELFNSHYKFKLINRLSTRSKNIAGIQTISEHELAYSSLESDSVSVLNIISGEEKIICKKGRNGEGLVRMPGALTKIETNLVISDRHNYLLQFIDSRGNFLSQIGGKGCEINKFDLVQDLLSISNNLIIADMNNDRVLMLNSRHETPSLLLGRAFQVGILSRPTSICLHHKKLFICDRGNNVIQTFSLSGISNGIFPRNQKVIFDYPSAFWIEEVFGVPKAYILERGHLGLSKVVRFDLSSEVREFQSIVDLKDAQGMVVTTTGEVVISDTLNHRAVRLTSSLEFISEIDLLKFSQNKDFLCRVPSLIGGYIYFPDHKSGLTLVFDSHLSYVKTINFELGKIDLYVLRRIVPYENDLLLLGRGTSIQLVDQATLKVKNSPIFSRLNNIGINNIADILFYKDDIFVCDKENDRIIKYNPKYKSTNIIGSSELIN